MENAARMMNTLHTPRAWHSLLIAAATALVAIAIVYPGMMLGREIPISNEGFALSDLLDTNVPLRVWSAERLALGHLPLWYPAASGGLPITALPEAASYYPPSTLFYMILRPGPATAYTIIFHLVLAGVGAAMLARHWGAKISGQMLAAVLMSVGLHLPAHMRQLNLMQAEAWIPLAWLFLDRLLDAPTRRNGAGLGFSLGMLGLAGHPEILHHTAVIFAFWSLIRVAGLRRDWHAPRFWTARAATILLAVLLAAAIAMPSLGPTLEMFRHIDRSQSEKITPSLNALATLVRPMALGDPMQPDTPANPFFKITAWEQMLYIGLLPLALALCAPLNRSRRRLILALFILAALSLTCVYASNWGGTRWIVRLIPMETSSRFPHRYLWCFNTILIISAALGVAHLSGFIRGRFKFLLIGLVLLISVLDIALATRRLNPIDDGAPWLSRPESLDWLEKSGASPDAFAERLTSYGNLRVLKEAFDVKPAWNPNAPVDTETHRLFIANHPSMWGWPVTKGYVGMQPAWVGLVTGDQYVFGLMMFFDANWGKKLDESAGTVEPFVAWTGFYGGRWLASPIELKSARLRPVGLVAGKHFDCYLYENRAWAGPAWLAHNTKTFPTDVAMLGEMVNAAPDRSMVRMLRSEAPSPFVPMINTTVTADRIMKLESPDPEHVTIDCEAASAGFLVLNQNYHPRWRVRIDGGDAQKTLRVNLSQTAVRLQPGKHSVEFEYSGDFEKVCLALGLIGIMVCFAFMAVKGTQTTPGT